MDKIGFTDTTVGSEAHRVAAVWQKHADLIECSEFAIPALSDHK